MAVLICHLFAIIHNSIRLLSYYIFVDQSYLAPCLVSLQENYSFHCHQKAFFLFSLNYFGSICNKSLGVLGV